MTSANFRVYVSEEKLFLLNRLARAFGVSRQDLMNWIISQTLTTAIAKILRSQDYTPPPLHKEKLSICRECGSPVRARGLCIKHYSQHYRKFMK